MFLGLIFLAAIPISVFAAWANHSRAEKAEVQFDRIGELQANATRDALLSVIDLKEEVLAIVAGTASTIEPWNRETLQALADAQLKSSGSFDALVISDSHGISVALAPSIRADGSHTSSGVNYSSRQYYKDLVRTGETSYGPLVMGKQSRVPNIHVAVPIHNAGDGPKKDRLRGYVTGSIRTAVLHDVALRSLSSTQRRVVVIDDNGQIVVDSNNKLSPMSDATQLRLHALPCDPKGADLVNESGLSIRASCAPMVLGAQRWSVWITAPRYLITNEAAHARNSLLQVALVLLLTGLMLSAWATARVGTWIRNATYLATRVGDGDLQLTVPEVRWHHPREFHVLRNVLLQTLKRLRANDTQVQQLVGQLTALNEQLQPYADAWAEVSDAIEILDHDANVMFVNPAFTELTGRQDKIIGFPSPLRVPYGEADQSVVDLVERAQKGEPWREQLRVRIGENASVHDINLTPVLDDSGRLARIVVTRRDVTRVRNAQAAAVHNDRLAALGTMAAGLAHEINNPLTYIRMSLEMVRMERTQQNDTSEMAIQISQSVTDAIKGVERVTEIVQDMLGLARSGEVGDQPNPLVRLSLANVIRSSKSLTYPQTKHSSTITIIPSSTPEVMGRKAELMQLLLNLVINADQAMRHMPKEESQICIRIGSDNAREVWLEVEDNGPGISGSEIDRIFEPFYTSKPVGQGAGLGLAVSRSIVSDMGGTLTVSSKPGKTCFRANLVAAMPADVPRPPVAETAAPLGARILVIDDDPRVARGIKLMLRKYNVTIAEDGPRALELMRDADFDLIICDVMMPVMDGPTVYQNLKVQNMAAADRLVFLTGAATTHRVRKALRATGRRVLSKPTSRIQLEGLLSQYTVPGYTQQSH